MDDGTTFLIVMYSLGTFIAFTGALCVMEETIGWRKAQERTRYARWALAAPLWPLTVLFLIGRGFVRLVRTAIGR